MKSEKSSGFTVIELIVVILIIGIIAVVAAAMYRPYVLKSHRADGISAIATLQLAEERYRSANTSYGTLVQLSGSATSAQGYYTIAISGVSATGYTITATGVGTQANDVDGSTACGTLTLTVSNMTVTQTPAACWPS